jgi:hypothetical protein
MTLLITKVKSKSLSEAQLTHQCVFGLGNGIPYHLKSQIMCKIIYSFSLEVNIANIGSLKFHIILQTLVGN